MPEKQKKPGGRSTSGPQSKSAAKPSTSKRGFASMDDEKQREIASMGGKASHSHDKKK